MLKALCFCLIVCTTYPGSSLGAEIDVDVEPVVQDTLIWCWVATARMVIKYYNEGDAPRQCEILQDITPGAPPGYCCSNKKLCMRSGQLYEIQNVIKRYTGLDSVIKNSLPTSNDIATALEKNRLIIAATYTGPMAGHVVLIKGIRKTTRNGVKTTQILINDPMEHKAKVVSFAEFKKRWKQSIVVQFESESESESDT